MSARRGGSPSKRCLNSSMAEVCARNFLDVVTFAMTSQRLLKDTPAPAAPGPDAKGIRSRARTTTQYNRLPAHSRQSSLPCRRERSIRSSLRRVRQARRRQQRSSTTTETSTPPVQRTQRGTTKEKRLVLHPAVVQSSPSCCFTRIVVSTANRPTICCFSPHKTRRDYLSSAENSQLGAMVFPPNIWSSSITGSRV